MGERNEEKERLTARLDDYRNASSSGRIAVSRFLTPGEQKTAERFFADAGMRRLCLFWGGYPEAERKLLYLLPEYYSEMPEWIPAEGSDPGDVIGEDERVAAIRIAGSGFRTLTHRDYLGSVTGLGVERDSFGDIAVQDEHSAVLFCTATIAAFLIENLTQVASDKVRCTPYTPDGSFTDGRRYRPIADTVASPRLDCIVAALTNLSREAAQTLIRSGMVEVDYKPEERTDRQLNAPSVLTVRGYGKFNLRSFDGETKKGRLRMRADQLI